MPSEVFGWPEGEIYIYPSGTTSALAAYAQNLNFTKTWDIQKIPLFGGTGHKYTRYVTKDMNIAVSIGQLFHTMGMWSMAQSATAMYMDLRHSSVAGNSAGFCASGVRFTEFSLRGSEGGVMESTVSLIMPDVLAYGTGI
jgi:hypothetical protein